MRRPSLLWLLLCAPVWMGCYTTHTMRFPNLAAMPSEYERREAQIHDPFPDTHMGPETFTRPRDFRQRPISRHDKDKFYASMRRQTSGAQFPVIDTRAANTGKKYPAAVKR